METQSKQRDHKTKLSAKSKLLARHIRSAASAFIIGIIASLLATLLRMLFTQVIRFAVDHVLMGDVSTLPPSLAALAPGKLLLGACAVAAAIALLEFVVGFVQDTSLPTASERFVKSLRDALYSHIQRLPYSWHVENATGDIIQRCTNDIEVVRAFVMDQMLNLLRTVFFLAVYMITMFRMHAGLATVAFAFVPIVLTFTIVFYSRISRRYQEVDEASGALSTVVQENLTGVRVVRAFGREQDELKKFNKKNQHYTNLWIKLGGMQNVFWTAGDLLSALQVLCVVLLGVIMCVKGSLSLGTYYAFISYTRSLSWPLRQLGRVITDMSKAGVSIDRLLYILEEEPEKAPEHPVAANLHGEIRFEHVSFSYDKAPVLRDVSFTIPGGSTFGVLGETGSGKSTIALLLARLYDPDEGRITIGGVDLRDMDPHALRRGVGVVLQEPFLYSRTLKENIAITLTDEESGEDLDRRIDAAVRDACLTETVEEFVDGYDTVVGERGVTLSGGQKQRVAIARTLLTGAPVMVFDDALSAVDAKTDEAIRTRLRAAAGGSTLMLIAHRVSTLIQADQIIVLKDGQIVERGTHESLLQLGGSYAHVAAMQSAQGEAKNG